jgi:DNA-binding PadR family transcriptional regulator
MALIAGGRRHGPGPFGGPPPFGRGGGPGRGFPFGPFGPFGRGPRARRGDVRAGILALLAEGPRNGYQIIQELGQRSGGAWRPSPGSIYPALQQLEDEGLVRAEEIDGKRAFRLTDAGRDYMAARREEPAAPWDAMSGGAEHPAMETGELLQQVALAAMQVVHTGTAAQQAEARQILTNARRSLYRVLAEDEPAGGSEAGPIGRA